MSEKIDSVTRELKAIADESVSLFGSLSGEQLNWQPAPKKWSVAQCFDHLITTHSLYFPLLEKLSAGGTKPTFWEKASPLSGFFGRFLIKSVDPVNVKPMKTTSKAFPSSSEIRGDIIDRFAEHQQKMADALNKLPKDIDLKGTIITSPLMSLVTYSIDDMLTVLGYHCRRHFNQASRVMDAPGFPARDWG